MQQDVGAEVRKFIGDNSLYREGVEGIDDGASFLEAGIIDSTGVLELVFFLESTYGIRVADEDMLPENLDSVRAVTAYVQRKLESQQARVA
jgi:acyl carrier protein